MSSARAKRLMAELLGLHAATERTDRMLAGVADRIHDHHAQRAKALAQRIPAPGARDDDLEEDYLESLFERDIAARYLVPAATSEIVPQGFPSVIAKANDPKKNPKLQRKRIAITRAGKTFDTWVWVSPDKGSRPISFSGKEFGEGIAQRELIERARQYARSHYAGKIVRNVSDGSRIAVSWQGIKKATSNPKKVSRVAIIALSKLDKVIEQGSYVGTKRDKQGRPEVMAFHYYDANVVVAGVPATIRVVVRETPDGKRFYHHYELIEKAP